MSGIAPYLSIVTVSRNDDHGGHLQERMQLFLDSASEQCNRYQLPVEMIIVEWNPPAGRQPLSEVLKIPANTGFFTTRIIVVPENLHATFNHADRLPLFQMIGKNVGIRRAKGDFILATNIDILFTDELIEFLSEKTLDPNVVYRADRLDIASPFNDFFFAHYFRNFLPFLQKFCQNNVIRINKKYGTFPSLKQIGFRKYWSNRIRSSLDFYIYKPFFCNFRRTIPFFGHIHTNGCGDFTLLSKEKWEELKGYPELEMFSWNIDSLFLILAYHLNIREIDLRPPKNIYHIEHNYGSGWTPGTGEKILFERIEKQQIPIFTWEDCIKISLILQYIGPHKDMIRFNDPGWGLNDYPLQEIEPKPYL
jgi:hypothetical protein